MCVRCYVWCYVWCYLHCVAEVLMCVFCQQQSNNTAIVLKDKNDKKFEGYYKIARHCKIGPQSGL